MLPEGRLTERHDERESEEDLEPRRIFVREEKGGEKEAEVEVRSPPTIYPDTHTSSSPGDAIA